jgi:REP element-mobilizing transposase RayT
VVDKRFAFEAVDKEQFRIYFRMMEEFTGCRVLSCCVMCNHFHLLLEVTPKPKKALTDEELLARLAALYSEAFVALLKTRRRMCNKFMSGSPTECTICPSL